MAEPSSPPSYMEATGNKQSAPYPAAGFQQPGNPLAAGQPGYPPAAGQPNPHAGGQIYPLPADQPYPPQPAQAYPQQQADHQQAAYELGQSGRAVGGDEEQGFSAEQGFNNKAIRAAFIKKVYFILFTQLTITFGIVCVFYFVFPVKEFVQNHAWLYWCSYAVFFVMYIVLACCGNVRRQYPGNFISLGVFTLSLSYMTGTIASYYQSGHTVVICMGICAAVTLGVSLFAIQTRFDFTSCGGFIFVFSLSVCLFGFMTIFTYSNILYTVYAWLAAVVFCLFLAYDTKVLIGGGRYELSPEEYIYGALNLYVDVIYLFLIILSLFGGSE